MEVIALKKLSLEEFLRLRKLIHRDARPLGRFGYHYPFTLLVRQKVSIIQNLNML